MVYGFRVFAATLFVMAPAFAAPVLALAQETLKNRIERTATDRKKSTLEGPLLQTIRDFYAKRDHRALWFEGERLSARASAVLDVLTRAYEHGLNPAAYGMPQLAVSARRSDTASHADVEVALTRAYLNYATDVLSGVVDNPRKVGTTFRDAKRPAVGKLLDDVANASDPNEFLKRLQPDTRRYTALKDALAAYRRIEAKGAWAIIEKGPALKPGMKGPRVAQVKRRLSITGDFRESSDSDTYDEQLAAAVKSFQRRHGLEEDGAVGADTLVEMNVPAKERIEQIVINLERRRWLAPYLGERYIYVNIADNDLKVVEKGKTIHVARVVVGKPFHETPVFSGTMTYIEVNPYWNVPHSIAINELLPKIRQNPAYLPANDYLLLTRMGDNNSAIDPASVNWSTITPQNFPFTLRQRPGAKNALGTMAFMFPNPHNVFIHDTSSRDLFVREGRFFSHGCMRVQFPMKLAILLLARPDAGTWTERKLQSIIDTKQQTRVDLKDPVAVHVTYLTAWADPDGTVQFRKDAYKRDLVLKKAIQQPASTK